MESSSLAGVAATALARPFFLGGILLYSLVDLLD
jgi:hypothetical protein